MLRNGFHDIPPGKIAVIVTYLEMTRKAAIKQAALPDGISFRRVAANIPWYRDIFTRIGAMNWLWYGRLGLSDPELGCILNDPKVEVFSLSRNGQDEALLELDFREDGACELAYFGLACDMIGSGFGRYLMNEAITRAWDKPISRFHVHTCTMDSPQALSFYQRSGFTPVRQAVEIDEDPRVIGVLPETAAANVPIFRP